MRRFIVWAAVVAFVAGFGLGQPGTVLAQWLKYPTPGVPKTADGKPNLAAPAPRTTDGKPDFSGIWLTDSPCARSQDPDTTVILMSDHGFGAIHKFVNFNIWLLREGFLKLKRDIPTQLKNALFNLGFTPSLGYKLSMNFGFANLRLSQGMTNRNQILDLVRHGFLSFRNVDWSRTRAFSSGSSSERCKSIDNIRSQPNKNATTIPSHT